MGVFALVSIAAVALTAWQAQADRAVFDPYVASLSPVAVMVGATIVGGAAMAYLLGSTDFAVLGPGGSTEALRVIAGVVPALTVAAIVADLVLRYPEDTNVALPDALAFYPAIAVLVEIALHLVPIAVLVAVLGEPTGLDASFWRIAIPVALIEAVLQAGFAQSIGTAAFSAVHVLVFGVVQVWFFWRFGFLWMLGFRLAYYGLWHVAWGQVRLVLLF